MEMEAPIDGLLEFARYHSFLLPLELKRQIFSYTPLVPSKTIPDSRPKCVKHSRFDETKTAKNSYSLV